MCYGNDDTYWRLFGQHVLIEVFIISTLLFTLHILSYTPSLTWQSKI